VSDVLAILPALAFMLIPILIPVVGAVFGALADLVGAHIFRNN
jgi:hypothetical protein